MFERVRHSRSQRSLQRSKASRQTHKANKKAKINQRGGDYTTLTVDEVTSWHDAIDKYDAQHPANPIASIKIMFTNAIPVAESDADKATRINAWITMIERQDEVARIAVRMAQETFLKSLVATGSTLTPPFRLDAVAIDALKDEELGPALEPYLNQLFTSSAGLVTSLGESLRQFVEIIGMQAGINYANDPPTNKFESMLSTATTPETQASEIMNILINPSVSENTFMQLICSNISLLFSKKDGKYMVEDILKNISTSGRVATPVEISTLNAYAEKYTYMTYGSLQMKTLRDARDGFILAGAPIKINTDDPADEYNLINFWSNFFKTLIEQYPRGTFTPLAPFEVAGDDHYGKLAAYGCLIKREKVSLESKLNPAGAIPALGAYDGFPNAAYHAIVYKDGKTLASVFTSIDIVSYLFMKHLLANISVE